jgi:hypothetical protein
MSASAERKPSWRDEKRSRSGALWPSGSTTDAWEKGLKMRGPEHPRYRLVQPLFGPTLADAGHLDSLRVSPTSTPGRDSQCQLIRS